MSLILFIVKLAIMFCPVLVLMMMHGAKHENNIASLLLFISALCTIPLFYAGKRYGLIWHRINEIEVFGITLQWYISVEIICFLLGLLVLSIKPKTDSDIEYDRFLKQLKADNDAKKEKEDNNNKSN